MQRWLAILAILLPTTSAWAQQDLNDTWMHYHLANGYNVRSDLARTRRNSERYRENKELAPDEDLDITMIFRVDRVPTIPGANASYDFFSYGFTFVEPTARDKGWGYEASIGLGMVDRQGGGGGSTKLVNFLLAAQASYEDYVTFGFDFTFNLLDAGHKILDLDQLSLYGVLPFIGAFTELRYDIGSQRVRNVESGVTYDFTKDKMGILTGAYYHRAPYLISGDVFTGVFEDPADRPFTIEGEHGGLARWERVGPFGEETIGFGFVGGVGLAVGTNGLRYAYVDAGAQIDLFRVFARVGSAYARLQDTHLAGGGGGAELYVLDGDLVIQAFLGRHDYEVVDRAGDTDGITLTLSAAGVFR